MILVERLYEHGRVGPEGIAIDRIVSVNEDPLGDSSWVTYQHGGEGTTTAIRVSDRVVDLVQQIQRVINGG